MNENITKEFIDRPIILVPCMAGRIAFIDGYNNFYACASMEAFHNEFGRKFLLPTYQLMVADPMQDPRQRECVLYGMDDGARVYLGSPEDSDLVTGMSWRLDEADRYSIINIDREQRLCLLFSKRHQKYLSVNLNRNYDPDGASYAIFANKTLPDECCVFAYCD